MEKTYIISWKARSSGRLGQGKRFMDKAAAEDLAAELNQEYPEYEHVVVEMTQPTAEDVANASSQTSAEPPPSSEPETHSSSTHNLPEKKAA